MGGQQSTDKKEPAASTEARADDVAALISDLKQTNGCATELDATMMSIGDAGMKLLCAEALATNINPRLHTLRLVRSGFTASGIDDLATAARGGSFPNLTDLNVSENMLGCEGCVSLGILIQHCPGLRALTLEECDLYDGTETSSLFTILAQSKHLIHLNVAWNHIAKVLTNFLLCGACMFLQNIVINAVLALDCSDELRTSCMEAICTLVRDRRLLVIGLSDNHLSDYHAEMLYKALQSQGQLMVINLERNTLTRQSINLLSEAIQSHRVAVARLHGNTGISDKDISAMAFSDSFSSAQVRGYENCHLLPPMRQGSEAFFEAKRMQVQEDLLSEHKGSTAEKSSSSKSPGRRSESMWCQANDSVS